MTSQLSSGVKVVSYSSRSNLFSRFRFIYETAKTEKPALRRYSLQQVLDNKTGRDFCGQGSRHQDSRSRSQQHKAKLATLAARSKRIREANNSACQRHRVRQGLLLQARARIYFQDSASFTKPQKRKNPIFFTAGTTKPAVIFAGRVLGIKTVAVEVSNIKQSLRRWPPVLRNAIGFAKVFCYKMADSVIVQSHAGRKSLSRLGVREKTQTVHNGIEIERIEKRSKEEATHRWFDEEIPVAVSVGRLVPSKGYENLVKTLSVVNGVTPLRLLLIGDGPLRGKIDSKARELGVGDKIDFTGSVPNPHKYAVKCDIFICSSLFEGFSNSLLEALALGLPIVSTDHDFGASEIIENGKSGILVPVGDPEKMAETVLRLLQDKTLATKMGEEARKRAREFSVEKMTRENLRVFRKIQEERT